VVDDCIDLGKDAGKRKKENRGEGEEGDTHMEGIGVDGKNHLRNERQRFVVPLQSRNAEARKRWQRELKRGEDLNFKQCLTNDL
jgi:hypothetical protein